MAHLSVHSPAHGIRKAICGGSLLNNEWVRSVAEIIPSPHNDPKTYDADIALLKLDTPVTFTKYIRPICLPPNDAANGITDQDNLAVVIGWGVTSNGRPSDVLRQTYVPIRRPLMLQDEQSQRYYLYGIVSWGRPGQCAVRDSYGVYVNVNNFTPWIREITNIQPLDQRYMIEIYTARSEVQTFYRLPLRYVFRCCECSEC
ncbi:clotting factor C-like [Ptychodera flava]|uniref:clotting factor C-like n=1 Tax=Ptychodera flava TaxID=63121 RepID=UPI00396A8C27